MALHSYSKDFIAQCVTEQNAYGTLTRLCEEVGERPSGSAEERRASELVAGLMSQYGLDVSTQEFTYDGWERGPTTVTVALGAAASSGGGFRELPCFPLGFCPPADLTAEVIDVGSGSEAEFAATDVAGKIALVSSATARNTPSLHRSKKYELADNAGAAGFAFYLDRPGGLTVMGSARLDATGCGRIPAVGLSYEDAMAIKRAAVARDGAARMRIISECRGIDAVSTNTIGLRPGAAGGAEADRAGGVAGEEIIVCGHIDSWFSPGAVDNGSGVASVLELARLLQPYDLKRSVRFVTFGSEELGILGSKAYVERAEDLSPVQLVLNIDVPTIKDGRLTITTNENPALYEFFASIGRDLNLDLELHPERIYHSDHARFRDNGIASAQFLARSDNTGFVHTAYDTLDKIDGPSFTIPLLVAGVAIIEAATADDLSLNRANR